MREKIAYVQAPSDQAPWGSFLQMFQTAKWIYFCASRTYNRAPWDHGPWRPDVHWAYIKLEGMGAEMGPADFAEAYGLLPTRVMNRLKALEHVRDNGVLHTDQKRGVIQHLGIGYEEVADCGRTWCAECTGGHLVCPKCWRSWCGKDEHRWSGCGSGPVCPACLWEKDPRECIPLVDTRELMP